MQLTVVNGANAISRGVLKNLAGPVKSVRLLDLRAQRAAVYALQEEIGEAAQLEKITASSQADLKYYLEGAENVLYFTHDYCTLSSAKNAFIEATAKSAKQVGVKKLLCVCPIEYDLYFTESD